MFLDQGFFQVTLEPCQFIWQLKQAQLTEGEEALEKSQGRAFPLSAWLFCWHSPGLIAKTGLIQSKATGQEYGSVKEPRLVWV